MGICNFFLLPQATNKVRKTNELNYKLSGNLWNCLLQHTHGPDSNYIRCRLGTQSVNFLIDSGSPVTTVPLSVWVKLKKDWERGDARLSNWKKGGSRELRAYGGSKPLEVRCSFEITLTVENHAKPAHKEEVYVMEEAKQALLGEGAAKAMKLLKVGVHVNQVRIAKTKIKNPVINPAIEEGKTEPDHDATEPPSTSKEPADEARFPSIPNFQLSFDIDKNIRPTKDFRYNIPESLEASLNENLMKLEAQGIIEPSPTTPQWVSRLKAVTKANGDVRWVVTMLGPNKAIRRVFYPMPTMDKLAGKMKGAKFFSKLDIKNAFFHVELDEEARQMTTFMTSKGPMRFTRLAFGVNCAPEAFQKIMEDRLRSCEGVAVFIDDILVYGGTEEELSRRTEEVKRRLSENNLTLNMDKCEFDKESVEFLGNTVSASGNP